MNRITLINPDNQNEVFVTEIRNNQKVEFRETRTSFTEINEDGDEIVTITITRKFLTSTN